MKTKKIITTVIYLCFGLISIQCTHEDEEINPIQEPNPIQRGSDQVLSANGYAFDKAHSSVRWETAYLGTAALLTGRFNEFSVELEFDEDDPEDIVVVGNVTLSSVNTGEPGRDDGCLLGTFNTSTSDEAIFKSKAVIYNEKGGYDVLGDLTFHGVISEVTMKLDYLGTNLLDLRGTPTNVAGFEAQFEMNAKTIYGIESDNIADRVVVKINAQFKQPQ